MASRHCGSHVHISPSLGRTFSLAQLRRIAFGIIFYEPLVQRLLPRYRQNNRFCFANTERSRELKDVTSAYPEHVALWKIWVMIMGTNDRQSLRNLMQGGQDKTHQRYVLWNFENTLDDGSGTIEFRGGPYLRSSGKTKRWISFVAAFAHLCLTQVRTP